MAEPIVQSAYSGLPVLEYIPTNIVSSGLLSETSSAPECFVNQRFSAKLQAFLVAYVNSTSSNYSVYGV